MTLNERGGGSSRAPYSISSALEVLKGPERERASTQENILDG
jgi:hypothetical protein